MRRVTVRLLLPVGLALALAGACRRGGATGGAAPPAMARAIAALPADVRIAVGVDVPAAAKSALVGQAITLMRTADPELGKSLESFRARCGIEPARDIDAIVVGLADPTAQAQSVLVAVGRFRPEALPTCIREALAATGGTLEASGAHWVARRDPAGPALWMAFATDAVTVAGSQAWLTPGPGARSQAAEYIDKVDASRMLWLAARLTEEEGQAIQLFTEGMTEGKVRAVYGDVAADEGLEIRGHFELESPSDAKAFAQYLDDRTSQFSRLATADELPAAAPSIKIKTDDDTVRVHLGLSGDQARQLEARLANQPETPAVEPDAAPGEEHRNEPAKDAAASGE